MQALADNPEDPVVNCFEPKYFQNRTSSCKDMRLCGALVLPPSVRSFEIPYVSLCHETVRHGSGGRDRGHSRPGAPNQAGAKELTQDLLYRPPIERKLSDEPSSNRLDTILADRNSDCHQPHDFALPLPMPLVEFLGALRVGDRGSVLRGRSGDGGAVPGSPETRAPSHGWRRAPRKRHGAGRYPLPTRSDFQTALKGDRRGPFRSTQAVAVHQDGIGGRGHPVGRCRSRTKQNSALCVAGTDCGLGGRVHAALMQGVVLSEN
jgi:hypothetical protein